MKRRITLFLVAIVMMLQPLMITLSYATDEIVEESREEVSESSEIVLNDTALYNALKEELSEKASFIDEENTIKISNAEIQNITKLILKDKGISNLTGIEKFTNLSELILSGNNLDKNSNLEKLNSLTNLTKLDLSSNNIEDATSIEGLLNKEGLRVDLNSQYLRIVDFIDILRVNKSEDAIEILEGKTQIRELEPIFLTYSDEDLQIKQLKVDGVVIDSDKIEDYVLINKEKKQFEFTPQDVKKYEIKLYVNTEKPNNKTTGLYKIYRIDKEIQEGIVFKDENLYKGVRDQLKDTFTTWTYDDEDLIIIAYKKELDTVNSITVNSRLIKDLTGIEKFVGLKRLDLSDNSVMNLNAITELYKNKEVRTKDLKEKYTKLVVQLKEYLTNESAVQQEIDKLQEEIDAIEKAAITGKLIESEENRGQKEDKINELKEKKEKLTTVIKDKTVEIDDLLKSLAGSNSGISNILTSPVTREEIIKAKEELENNMDLSLNNKSNSVKSEILLEQINLLKGNKLQEEVTSINESLNNLTNDEITNVLLSDTIKIKNERILTQTDAERIRAKYIIIEINDIIDKLSDKEDNANNVWHYAQIFNSNLSAEDIVLTEKVKEDGQEVDKLRAASTIKSEMKTSLNNFYLNCGSISGYEEIINLYIAMRTEAIYQAAEAAEAAYNNAEQDPEISTGTKIALNLAARILREAANNSVEIINKELEDNFELAKTEIIEQFKTKLTNNVNKANEEIQEEVTKAILNNVSGRSVNYDNLRTKLNIQVEKIIEIYDALYKITTNGVDTVEEGILGKDKEQIETLIDQIKNATELDEIMKKDLILIANKLEVVPQKDIDAIIEVPDLEILILNRNLISDVSELENVPTIKGLYLEDNLISVFDFTKFKDVELLDLNNNCIKDVEVSDMGKIKVLCLGGNRIGNIEKIDISGMPELENLILDNNEIDDIEKLINSTHKKLTKEGYKTLGDAIKADSGIINVSVKNQSLRIDLTLNSAGEYEIVKLPKIFTQVKQLQNEGKVTVVYDKIVPCTNVYSDGTNANIDTTMKDVQRVGYAIINMGSDSSYSYFADGTNCAINYIVVSDRVAPTITSVEGNPADWTNQDVTLTVTATDDKAKELSYSFNNGTTWQKENTKTYSENTSNIIIKVKDTVGNTTTYDVLSITKIDKTAPVISKVDGISTETTNKDVTLTVVATDGESGVSQYSFDNGATWQNENIKIYSENTSNIVIKVKDSAGNISEETTVNIANIDKTDRVAPTITSIEGNPEDWTNQDVTLTVVATDDISTAMQYSFDNGTTWQNENAKTYSENTSNIIVKVKDEAENISAENTVDITKIDKVAPIITSVEGNPTETTNQNVTLTVVATDETSGVSQYSFDNGATWQDENTKTYSENTSNIVIKVKDSAGNISEDTTINITKINKTPEPSTTLSVISDKYVVNTTSSLISNIPVNVKASELEDDLVTNATSIIIRDKQGNILSYNSNLATGMKITFELDDEIKSFTISVRGDVNGDAKVDFNDILQLNKQRLGKIQLGEEYKVAGDVNDDGIIDFNDILKINKFRLGKIEIL